MKRIVVWPDVHVPNHNVPAVNAALEFNRFYQPTHFIQLGDFCDWDSVSTYDSRREQDIVTIQHEIKESNNLLDAIEQSLPEGCEKFMVGGNHEARYEKFKVNKGFEVSIRRLKDFGNWHEEYELDRRGWGHCEYGEHHEIGKIIFTHGWYASGNHASRHLALFHKNIVYGHTHQFQVATAVGLDGNPVMAASIGTLSNSNLSYLVGKPPVNWLNMICYIDMKDDGTFSIHFVPIVNGAFFELGRQF